MALSKVKKPIVTGESALTGKKFKYAELKDRPAKKDNFKVAEANPFSKFQATPTVPRGRWKPLVTKG
jgi:hypothetical protein